MSDESERLLMIRPEAVREFWPQVRDRVAAIAARGQYGWLPEDVFMSLCAAQSFLHVTPDMGGFVVVQFHQKPEGKTLFVWLAHNRTDASAAAYWEQLGEIGAETGCVAREFVSDRRGFQRAIPGLEVRFVYSQRIE